MSDFKSLEEWLAERRGTQFMTMEEWLSKRSPVFRTTDEWTAERASVSPPKELDEKEGILGLLEQFGRGALSDISLGISKYYVPEKEPSSTAGRIFRGLGSLAGFLMPLGLASKGVKAATKVPRLLGWGAKAAEATKELSELQKAGRLAGHMAKGAATLGTAEAISDITEPSTMLQRAAHGAKMGAVFGAAGMIHFPKHPVLSQIVRQFGGRALMAATGEYQQFGEMIKPENLAQTVFNEALMTMFLKRGITPDEIINPQTTSKQNQAFINFIATQIAKYNEDVEPTFPLKIGRRYFQKAFRGKIGLDQISSDKKPNEKNVEEYREKLRKGIDPTKDNPVELQWDETKGFYVAPRHADFLKAMELANMDRVVNQEEPIRDINVVITKPKPGQQGPTLAMPFQVALLYKQKSFDVKLLETVKTTKYFAYNVDLGTIRPIPPKTNPYNLVLKSREILYEKGPLDEAGNLLLTPMGRGRLVKPFKWDKKDVLYPDKYLLKSRHLNKLKNDLIIRMEEKKANIEDKRLKHKSFANLQKQLDDLQRQVDEMDGQITALNLFQSQRYAKRDARFLKLKVKETDIKKITQKASSVVNKFYKSMEEPVPPEYLTALSIRLAQAKSGVSLEHLFNALEIKEVPKLSDLPKIEELLLEVEAAPVHDRPMIVTDRVRRQFDFIRPTLTGDRQEQQSKVDKVVAKERSNRMEDAYRKQETEKGTGNIIQQLLTLPRRWLWADFLKVTNHLQDVTGIPLYDLARKASESSSLKRSELYELMKPFNKFSKMSAEDQQKIGEYYDLKYDNMDTDHLNLQPHQHDFIALVDDTMAKLKPKVAKARHRIWMEEVYDKRVNPEVPEKAERQIFKQQRTLEPLLQRGTKAFMEQETAKVAGKGGLSAVAYDTWIEGEGLDLGGIFSGSYLPKFVLNINRLTFDYNSYITETGTIGTGHIKIRGKSAEAFEQEQMRQSMIDSFQERNLSARLYSYVNQILNLTYIEPHIKTLEKIMNIFPKEFENAKPPGFGRMTPEAKGMSLHDYFEVWAHRVKEYPVKLGSIGEFMRQLQSVFFRALTPRPFLWLRNMPQAIVTYPHKENILDPRFARARFGTLPRELQDMFERLGINQERAFQHEFLQIQSTERFKKLPFIGMWFDLAERVGKVYSTTDVWNRKFAYSKTAHRALFYLQKYRAGEVSLAEVEARLGIHIMESGAQRWFRNAVEKGEDTRAAFEVSKWMTENSQWQYRRTEKSLAEMTAEGESWTNLLTWSKSITQQSLFAFKRSYDGVKAFGAAKTGADRAAALKMMWSGASQVASLMIAGAIANEALATVSFAHKSRFAAYGSDMFMWEFGGVTAEIIRDFSQTASDMINAMDKSPEERIRARDAFLKMVDNVGIRQLLPFSKQAFAFIESVTGRSYMQPVYEKVNKLTKGYSPGETYVQRTMLEGIAHAITAADPSKQESVRKWANRKKYEFMQKAQSGTKLRPWFVLKYKQFTYLDNLLQRYTPYELYKDKVNREWLQWYKSFSSEEMIYNMHYRIRKAETEANRLLR